MYAFSDYNIRCVGDKAVIKPGTRCTGGVGSVGKQTHVSSGALHERINGKIIIILIIYDRKLLFVHVNCTLRDNAGGG